ncbi:Prefoldin subunit-domain-containing protein [Obelidium mucronatum]|nr:Prefoldin subunit-domain-containing protein [Obelidium mucronatum]
MADPLTTNPRGIPKAPFIDNVDQFVGSAENVESTLRKFQEMIAKYKTMEGHLASRRRGLESKIPEIKKTLDMVLYIISRSDSDEPITTEFEINDTLWVNAKVESTKTVCLWLGANVMLEYETGEARDLLTEKLGTAKVSLSQVKEDLAFLKEQITTMEVNFSRVHNWDVKTRKELKK